MRAKRGFVQAEFGAPAAPVCQIAFRWMSDNAAAQQHRGRPNGIVARHDGCKNYPEADFGECPVMADGCRLPAGTLCRSTIPILAVHWAAPSCVAVTALRARERGACRQGKEKP